MGDSARTKRREQLKRWAGSSTDRAPAAARRRWRTAVENGSAEAEAVLGNTLTDPSVSVSREETSPLLKRRKCVRFDRAAEFLAACASGDTEEAELMLKDNEDSKTDREEYVEIINSTNADGITALHQACIDGSMEMVSFLVEHQASVNQADSEGWTPLHVAASCGYPDIAEFLLQRGASLSAVNCDGDVPLDIALDDTTESLLQHYTLQQGVDVEAAKRLEEEQIMRDARAWLRDGPPANVQHPKTGATPLHVAAAKGYLEALKMLCQCGLDVSAKDLDGWTPLHAAAHWGQGAACYILAEQLCNMEAHSNAGQTPFDVADESVEKLLEELLVKQANWRNEQTKLERQKQQGSTAANTQPKLRRTSVCRMSSRDKINVQDQSKEKGVSGSLELPEERESSLENCPESGPDGDGGSSPTETLIDPAAEDKDKELQEQDKQNRTARVQPTPQTKDSDSPNTPNTPNTDRRKFQAPVRDEESESQRKARSRMMRQSRRSTQGVTLTDLKEAEKTVARTTEPPVRSIQPVTPIITLTPAQRDAATLQQEELEADRCVAVRDRRRGRKERRSTGIVQDEAEEGPLDDTYGNIYRENQLGDWSADYRTLYFRLLQDNLELKEKLQEMELLLSQNKVELERLRQSQEGDRPALMELGKFEKLSLQRRAVELEDELKVLGDLRSDNQRLKDENAALIRVISKLSR
ncbi:protein phosphatase 1 regulatory subunit 12C [Takifugu rubripes]|uniref:protein phosphatase 1 regulatory subunit 12C n=1 Tax=Takifugu rubripes TaxID=31033 RepID=UPI001145AC99|nr:protein phosphatase 1 regulatory subunit 12C [Takifugu rubripes]